MGTYALEPARLAGTLHAVQFKNYLYWRDQGFPEAGIVDAFGSALIRSSDGRFLLGRQNSGHMNEGKSYLPSGLIDRRDVGADGRVDIEASIRREISEETGLAHGELERTPGYIVTRTGAQMSIAVEFRSRLTGSELAERIGAHIAADDHSELSSVSFVGTMAEAGALDLPPFTSLLLGTLLA